VSLRRYYIFVIRLKNSGLGISPDQAGAQQPPFNRDPASVIRKGEAGSSDIPKLGPASLALEATTMFTRKQYERWSEEDDRALRTMSEAGKSLTLITVKLNRPMASIKARAADLHITLPGTEIGHRRKRKQSA
jgi:hypothetical protein